MATPQEQVQYYFQLAHQYQQVTTNYNQVFHLYFICFFDGLIVK